MFFSLKQGVYAAQCDLNVILLDANKDKYFSISTEVGTILLKILTTEFDCRNGIYISLSEPELEESGLNYWVKYFTEAEFIEPGEAKRVITQFPSSLVPGGLSGYEWDRKDRLISVLKISPLLIVRLLWVLMKVDFTLRRKGISGILSLLKKLSLKQSFHNPDQVKVDYLSDALDAACTLYPKKMYCLSWAAAFTLVALKKGWRCSLVIGAQSPPFYAHAWAEINGTVINDKKIIQERLAIFFKEPFNEDLLKKSY